MKNLIVVLLFLRFVLQAPAHPLLFADTVSVPIGPEDCGIDVVSLTCAKAGTLPPWLCRVTLAEFKYELQRACSNGMSGFSELDTRQRSAYVESYASELALACLAHSRLSARMDKTEKAMESRIVKETAQALLQSVISTAAVSPGEAEEYYMEHVDEFTEPGFVTIDRLTCADREQADRAFLKLAAGLPFPLAAQKYSIDPMAKKGGQWGTYRLGFFSAEVSKMLEGMAVGRISEVTKVARGRYAIFRKTGYRPSRPIPIGQVMADLRRIIIEKRQMEMQEDFLSALRAAHRVRYRASMLTALLEATPTGEELGRPLLSIDGRDIPLARLWREQEARIAYLAIKHDKEGLDALARAFADRLVLLAHVRDNLPVYRRRWPYIEAAVRRRELAKILAGDLDEEALARLGAIAKSSFPTECHPALTDNIRILRGPVARTTAGTDRLISRVTATGQDRQVK